MLDIASVTTIQRGNLSHHWLEKLIKLRTAEDIADFHGASPACNERAAFERHIKLGGEYDRYLSKARGLVNDMVEGFSPAQLVDRGPLAALSDTGRTLLKKVLHRAYLEATTIESLKGPICSALDAYEAAFGVFREAWYREPRAPREEIATTFDGLLAAARGLFTVVNKLPKGIVLP